MCGAYKTVIDPELVISRVTKKRITKIDEPLLPATWFGLVCDQLRKHDSPLRGFLSKKEVRTRRLFTIVYPRKDFQSGTTHHNIAERGVRAWLLLF
jgi:hypothetical protein